MKYFCDCPKLCDGIEREVSRSTYQRHAPYRIHLSRFSTGFREYVSSESMSATSSSSTSAFGSTHLGAREDVTGMSGTGQSGERDIQGSSQVCTIISDTELDHPFLQDDRTPSPSPDMLDMSRNDEGPRSNTPPPVPPTEHAEQARQQSPPPDNSEDFDIEGLADLAQLADIKIAMSFIAAVKNASLDDNVPGLSTDALNNLRNPPRQIPTLSADDRLSLELFLAIGNASDQTYDLVRTVYLRRHPDSAILSLYRVKRLAAQLSGVESIAYDMCINSCVAYTGPFTGLEICPQCGEPRYDQLKLTASGGKLKATRQQFHTIPIGPQLQALWRDPQSARAMRYREKRTQQIIDELSNNNGFLRKYDDFFCGTAYLDAVAKSQIKPGDMILMFSIDGAQLYESKASDCWISIWVIFDHSPDTRYKKMHVLPGFFIPGPNKPKHLDSFFFPSLHHLAAIQKEGLPIWDSAEDRLFLSNPFLALATADVMAMIYLNGFVGHHGKNGCRLYCGLTGRHKPDAPHYFPALLKPNNYHIHGCDHDDIDIWNLPSCSTQTYQHNLRYLMASRNEAQFRRRRLETGITKPSIFLGLNPSRTLGVPLMFGSDIMHLGSLNIPDLLISLWRGTFDCDKNDSLASWDWAVLRGDTWNQHGAAVAKTTRYLPSFFGRPPRNPAEKISSGYKAWEFLTYLFVLGPGLFYGLLPDPYWRNFCKLVFAMRVLNQHQISREDLQKAHQALLEFEQEFELLYYQRRTERLHFVRPCVHSVTHLAAEVLRIGPPICSSQWTLERAIGDLGQEIRQPSNPYANLSQRGVRRARVNALKAMIPDLEPLPAVAKQGAINVRDGYVLLRAKERSPHPVRPCEAAAIYRYINGPSEIPGNWCPSIVRWARLRLPNGQIARTAWKENQKEKLCSARMVKVCCSFSIYTLLIKLLM